MAESFNLLTEKWIPVLWNDGRDEPRVGIQDALMQAGRIRQIASSNPMGRVAMLRFLLACMQWCEPNPSQGELTKMSDVGGIPKPWLEPLNKQQAMFNLLGQESGFFQDFSARDTSPLPVTSLIPEWPTPTSIAHFRHTRDYAHGLCPACCAAALVRCCAYITPTCKGSEAQMPAAINGGRPTYAVPYGNTLLETIRLNWPLPQVKGDRPGWMGNDALEADRIGGLAGFTWRPRKVWLMRPDEDQPSETCAYCASSEYPLIYHIAFRPGWKRPFQKEAWPGDPHLLFFVQLPTGKRKKPELSPVSFPKVTVRADLHARQWRNLYVALLQSLAQEIKEFSPAQHRHIRMAVSGKQTGKAAAVVFFGAAVVNQALYQDAIEMTWRFPTSNLTSENLEAALAELVWLNAAQPWAALAQGSPRKARKRPEVGAALSGDAARTESILRGYYEAFFQDLLGGDANAGAAWRARVHDTLSEQVRDAQASFTTGTYLNRRFSEVIAQEKLQRDLEKPRNDASGDHSGREQEDGNDDSD